MTGGGGFIGRQILARILDRTDSDVILLERGRFRDRLNGFLDGRVGDRSQRARVRVFEGDITLPNLGLSPDALDEFRERVTHAVHLAALYNLSIPRDAAVQINVEGTRNVLDVLQTVKRLQSFVHTSTLAVAGNHAGLFSEDDFDLGQSFRNYYEETKFLSEKLVRERAGDLPTVIIRPPVVVGDSKTGEIEKIDGPYYAFVMIKRRLHWVIPDSKGTKCHIGPVDYVADAFQALLFDEAAAGRTFLLTDPHPLTYNAFFDLACETWGRFKPLLHVPPAWLAPIARTDLFRRVVGVPYEAYLYSDNPVEYSAPKTVEALARHGIACPPVHSYIDVMIRYFLEHYRDDGIRRGDWRQATS